MPEPVQGFPAATVLVVDDSRSVCAAIERMLRPRGFEVVGVQSAEAALARLAGEPPDLILCDMLLPDLPGVEVCRAVRSSERLLHVPLVLISGQTSEEMAAQAADAGADALLKKPFRSDDLIAQVEALLADSAASAEQAATASDFVPAWRYLADLEQLPGLRGGSWRLANGQRGRFGASAESGALDPQALLAGLRRGTLPSGLGAPVLACLEDAVGELVLVGEQPAAGSLLLRLAASAGFGRARYLARMFLRNLPRFPPLPSARKEPLPWKQ